MSSQVDEAEVRRWVELLRSTAEEDRLTAAAQLGRLGVRTRGAVMTRGSLAAPAPARLAAEHLAVALQALADARPEVRREVAFVLGEWADETAVTVLMELAQRDQDWRVRAATTDALAQIGGPGAVGVLQIIATKDRHEDVRASAVDGLALLALAGAPAQQPAPMRTRGAVRTRGGVAGAATRRVGGGSPEATHILQLLEQIRTSDPSDYVQTIAAGTLAGLTEQ